MTTSSREATAQGDIIALIDSLGPDQRDERTVTLPNGEVMSATFALVGRTQLMVRSDGEIGVHIHDTDEDAAHCYQYNLDRTDRLITALASGDRDAIARALVNYMGDEPTEWPTESLPAPMPVVARGQAPVRYASTGEPGTGLYL